MQSARQGAVRCRNSHEEGVRREAVDRSVGGLQTTAEPTAVRPATWCDVRTPTEGTRPSAEQRGRVHVPQTEGREEEGPGARATTNMTGTKEMLRERRAGKEEGELERHPACTFDRQVGRRADSVWGSNPARPATPICHPSSVRTAASAPTRAQLLGREASPSCHF